jgi:hypothetical protein
MTLPKMLTVLDPRFWLALAVAAAFAYGGGRFQQYCKDADRHAAKRVEQNLEAARAQAVAVSGARAEEQRRTRAQQEIASNAQDQLNAARADAVAAADVSRRLRQRVDALLASHAAGNPAATCGRAPDANADALLAELFRSTQERLGTLAQDVDAARTAGLACEQAYSALTAK